MNHPEWTVGAFTLLARNALTAGELQQVLAGALPLLLVALLCGARTAVRARTWTDVVEVVALVIAFLALPPLVSFTLYFCCVHSPRHLGEVSRSVPSVARLVITAALFTALTSAVAVGMLWINRGTALEPTLMSVIFIGLSVLTVPHLWTVANWQRSLRLGGLPMQDAGPECPGPGVPDRRPR